MNDIRTKYSLTLLSLILMAGLALLPSLAFAFGPGGIAKAPGEAARQNYIQGHSRVTAPFAHVVFCVKTPQDCRASSKGNIRSFMSKSRLKEIMAVNRMVNNKIIPREDNPRVMGGDVWSLNPTYGDCDDYAITKRHELLKRGWPSSLLRLAVAQTPSGEGHLVLIVTNDLGDLVLNNLTQRVLPWQRVNLRWKFIQDKRNPQIWRKI